MADKKDNTVDQGRTQENSEQKKTQSPTVAAKAPSSPKKRTTRTTQKKSAGASSRPATPKRKSRQTTKVSASAASGPKKRTAAKKATSVKPLGSPTSKKADSPETTKNAMPAATDNQTAFGQNEEDKANKSSTGGIDIVWRFLAILLFGFLSYILLLLAWVGAAVQFLFIAIKKEPNRQIDHVMTQISAYLAQILHYLAGRTDASDLPFPFGSLPATDPTDNEQAVKDRDTLNR